MTDIEAQIDAARAASAAANRVHQDQIPSKKVMARVEGKTSVLAVPKKGAQKPWRAVRSGPRPAEPPPRRWVEPARRVVLIACLIGVGVWAYGPALNRYFAADQIFYFAELKGDQSLAAGLKHLDYSLSRQFNKGDELLFRPLLFVLLAVENAAFGLDPFKWNVVNLVLHLCVCYLLYEFIRTYVASALAELTALWFAAAHAQVELVMWNHVGGYILAYALLLLGLLALRKMELQPDRLPRGWLILFAIGIGGAIWCYELGVICAILLPVYLWWQQRRGALRQIRPLLLAILVPLVAYLVTYAIRSSRAPHLAWVDMANEATDIQGSTLYRSLIAMWEWLSEVLNPRRSLYAAEPYKRFARFTQIGAGLSATVVLGVLAILALTALRRGIRSEHLKRCWPFAGMIALLTLAYAMMNASGRSYIDTVTYYHYLFFLLLLLCWIPLLDLGGLRVRGILIVAAVLVTVVCWEARVTRQISDFIGRSNAKPNDYFTKLDRFIEQHRNETDFSFVVLETPEWLDPPWALYHGYSGTSEPEVLRVSDLLFRKYAKRPDAKYKLSFAFDQAP